MGLLVEGKWVDRWYDTKKTGGRFVRKAPAFRNFITADDSSGFLAEPDRYHLYVSLACPWAHRTLIFRKLKKLEDLISVSVVDFLMKEEGWIFSDKTPGATLDDVNGCDKLYQVYTKALSDYTGRVTVPVLWDKKKNTIVNNESSEIIRMLNSAFNAFGDDEIDFYPEALREEIDAINEKVYHNINNGVYKCGFATTQEAYEEAFDSLFTTLDELEEILGRQSYLCGEKLTEADWRLFTTLIRFDLVYYGHFKCNLRHIEDYPNLSNYLRALYQVPGVAETCNFKHIKDHYYASHESINPSGVVPKGPLYDFHAPHNRGPVLIK